MISGRCLSLRNVGMAAIALAMFLPGEAVHPAQAQSAPGVSGSSKALAPTDNCLGDNAERYNLSSRCDPDEHRAALSSLDALRSYYALLGGDDGEEVRMIDELRKGGLIRFHPPADMPNGDLGNYAPGFPRGELRINADWLARMAENNPRLPPFELFADLAGTIYHENIHRNQNLLRYSSEYYRETQAWGMTLNRMGQWIDSLMKRLDTVNDPVAFENAQKLIDGAFGAWLNKAGPELFTMVNSKQIGPLDFVGPCGIKGTIIGDAKLNVARNAVKACRERLRARKPPGFIGPVRAAPVREKRPLDDLARRFMTIAIADIATEDLGRVCNTRMGLDRGLLEASGRGDLANASNWPFVKIESAALAGDSCQIRVNLRRYTPPGVTLTCTVKVISWNFDAALAVAERGEGGSCQ